MLALVLGFILVLQPLFAFPIFAEEEIEEAPYEYTIPTEIIPKENIELYGHSQRVFNAEGELNEICLLNEDGSNSLYMFDYPVKYIDDDGITKDKSNKLHASKRNNYLYVNDDNDIKTYFPKKITKKPIIIEADTFSVEIGIVTDSKYSKKGEVTDDNYVFYNQAFGENTAIQYKPTFSGYKEEIILYNKNAPTQYSFKITCKEMYIEKENGILYFISEKTDDVVFITDPFYIYDSSKNVNEYVDTQYNLVKTNDYEYLLTITVDQNYLDTEGLTYPVYIDPAVNYKFSTNNIYDVPIYSGKADTNCKNHLISYIGKHTDDYGVGRLLVKFPQLAKVDTIFQKLETNEIISVNLYLYNQAYGDYASTVKVYDFEGNSWTADNATWNSVSPYSVGDLQVSRSFSNTESGYYSMNITTTALRWRLDTATAIHDPISECTQGLIIINSNESSNAYTKCIRMYEMSSSYAPYIVLNYSKTIEDDTYYVQNCGTKLFMDLESASSADEAPIQQWSFHTGAQAKWIFARQSDGYYTIKSSSSRKYVGVKSNSTLNNTAIVQYASSSNSSTKWGISLSSSGNYIFTAKTANSYNRVLSVPSGQTSNGIDFIQFSYTDDTAYNDEWQIYPTDEYLISFSHWYSDGDRIGIWASYDLTYYSETSVSTFPNYAPGLIHAMNEWMEGIGVNFSATNQSSAKIHYYGVTKSTYYSLTNQDWPTGLKGYTIPTMEYFGYGIYNNEVKKIYLISSADIYLLENSNLTTFKNTATHELGHALGYLDHCPYAGAVMYHENSIYSTLTIYDKNHLTQLGG